MNVVARITQQLVYYGVPLVGIFYFGWDWRPIIVLYWLENVSVGVETLINMIRTPYSKQTQPSRSNIRFTFGGQSLSKNGSKPGLVVMFFVHYSFFTLVHGVFVGILISGFLFIGIPGQQVPSAGFSVGTLLTVWIIASVIQLVQASRTPKEHLLSIQTLFTSPYKRIFVLHITIIAGVGLIMWFGWPPIAAVLLVALHAAIDLPDLLRTFRTTPKTDGGPKL